MYPVPVSVAATAQTLKPNVSQEHCMEVGRRTTVQRPSISVHQGMSASAAGAAPIRIQAMIALPLYVIHAYFIRRHQTFIIQCKLALFMLSTCRTF